MDQGGSGEWFRVVQSGSEWFRAVLGVVKSGSEWFRVVQGVFGWG